MPSPFPGMDPYLEDPALWRTVHTVLITASAALLQPSLLARGYFVTVEGRVWLDDPERPIYPDVVVWERVPPEEPVRGGPIGQEADTPVRLLIPRLETQERFLEIRQVGSRKLVTSIEVISPANKSHTKARALYLRKRKELRIGRVNIVEIDLLRRGKPLAAIPPQALEARGKDDYVVNVIRAGGRYYEYYPIPFRNRLPRIRVPLSAGDEDAVLDLPAVLARTYDEGGYAVQIDYHRPPRPPLSPDNAAWAEALLIEKGVRTQN